MADHHLGGSDSPDQVPEKLPIGKRLLRVVLIVGLAGLMIWLLSQMVDWGAVLDALRGVSFWGFVALFGASVLFIVGIAVGDMGLIKGLRFGQAVNSSTVSSTASMVIPFPGEMVIRLGMYRSYGISLEAGSTAMVLSGALRYMLVALLPGVAGLAILITGRGDPDTLGLTLIALVLGLVVLGAILLVIRSEKVARAVGRVAEAIWTGAMRVLRRPLPEKPLRDAVMEFRETGIRGLSGRTRAILLTSPWGLVGHYLVLLAACRAVGIDSEVLSWADALLVLAVLQVVAVIPITPGGIGFGEAAAIWALGWTDPGLNNLLMAAMLLYRTFTMIIPIPFGLWALSRWRKRDAASAEVAAG
jgi:uncharacterized membrane protein YbhN (UPF0104 family)